MSSLTSPHCKAGTITSTCISKTRGLGHKDVYWLAQGPDHLSPDPKLWIWARVAFVNPSGRTRCGWRWPQIIYYYKQQLHVLRKTSPSSGSSEMEKVLHFNQNWLILMFIPVTSWYDLLYTQDETKIDVRDSIPGKTTSVIKLVTSAMLPEGQTYIFHEKC